MFTIRAKYGEQFTVRASLERVRAFFADTRNFVEMMPGIESIRADADGSTVWTIRAEIPFLGAMSESFDVELTENSDERLVWRPAADETENFLRYAADFAPQGNGQTTVQIQQTVELRRQNASDLHFLAGFAGESAISGEMQRHVETMIKSFLNKAKAKLESATA